jgi:hypothetical protein
MCALSLPIYAQPTYWMSARVEMGYGKAYISQNIKFEKATIIKNSTSVGLKFKLFKEAEYKAFYLLEKPKKNNWSCEHFLGASLNFKFK